MFNGRSHGNKILKLRKKRPIIAHVISENWHETASKDATKKGQESCVSQMSRGSLLTMP